MQFSGCQVETGMAVGGVGVGQGGVGCQCTDNGLYLLDELTTVKYEARSMSEKSSFQERGGMA